MTEDGRFIIDTVSVIQTAQATVPYPQGPSCIALRGAGREEE